MSTNQTRGKAAAADVVALLRARNPLLWIVTREEARAEALLFEAAGAANYVAHTWDVAQGAAEIDGKAMTDIGGADPGEMLDGIKARALTGKTRDVWIMRDLPVWLDGTPGAAPCRRLRNLARLLPSIARESAQAIIVITTSAKVPEDLQGHATVIEWPLPDRQEIAAMLDASINSLPPELKASAATNGTRDAAIDAAVGLTGEEAQACFARSLVQFRCIDPTAIAKEKRRIIAREGVLQWYDPIPGGLDAVGGLENLKAWLVARRSAYSPAARAYGLPAPRGCLLVGISGCGKSLTPKALATTWGVPLLRLDLGAVKSKWVGDSEANLRKVFRVVEAIGRCVLWIDEVEKALAGATQGAADGGVSSDALGALLNWMQERAGEAFVVATANSVDELPPEFLRKGRFDELWWVDLPTQSERVAILEAALTAHGRSLYRAGGIEVDANEVAKACRDFTGAEIAALVPDALFTAFNDGAREIVTADLIQASRTVTPLAKTAEAKIKKMREWGTTRARPASIAATQAATASGRQLDI